MLGEEVVRRHAHDAKAQVGWARREVDEPEVDPVAIDGVISSAVDPDVIGRRLKLADEARPVALAAVVVARQLTPLGVEQGNARVEGVALLAGAGRDLRLARAVDHEEQVVDVLGVVQGMVLRGVVTDQRRLKARVVRLVIIDILDAELKLGAVVLLVDLDLLVVGVRADAQGVVPTLKAQLVDLTGADPVAADRGDRAGLTDRLTVLRDPHRRGVVGGVSDRVADYDERLGISAVNRGVGVEHDLLNLQVRPVEEVRLGAVVVLVSLAPLLLGVGAKTHRESPSGRRI